MRRPTAKKLARILRVVAIRTFFPRPSVLFRFSRRLPTKLHHQVFARTVLTLLAAQLVAPAAIRPDPQLPLDKKAMHEETVSSALEKKLVANVVTLLVRRATSSNTESEPLRAPKAD